MRRSGHRDVRGTRPTAKESTVRESDWRLFQKRVPEWRERYLQAKNQEILTLLTDEKATPTERFWNTKHRLESEAHILRDCLDGHSRSSMEHYLSLMHLHGLIQEADLEEFSEELRRHVLAFSRISRGQ